MLQERVTLYKKCFLKIFLVLLEAKNAPQLYDNILQNNCTAQVFSNFARIYNYNKEFLIFVVCDFVHSRIICICYDYFYTENSLAVIVSFFDERTVKRRFKFR